MDASLVNMIEGLPRDQALEAARFVAEAMGVTADEQAAAAVAALTDAPYESLEEIDQLARLLLLASAVDPDLEDGVRTAIEGAGRKQFIFGGAEIVALAVLAVSALHVVISKGKKAETERVEISTKADGMTVTTIDRKVTYGISARLGKVLTGYFGT